MSEARETVDRAFDQSCERSRLDAGGDPRGVLVAAWLAADPLFVSATSQSAIHGATIVTFWIVFLIERSESRSDRAVHEKLDEILGQLDAGEAGVVGEVTGKR